MGRQSFQTQSGARATVGLFVDWLEDGYQNSVLTGVADAARRSGVNLICFAGGVLGSPHRFGLQRNAVYNLAGPENIDGLMIMSGSLGNHLGEEALARYCDHYRPLPMCSIAVALPGIPSVLVDNATGMRAALVHLIEAHGRRRVAFIRGPAANTEAERRYRVYRDVLVERGLPFDPALVVIGDFQRSAGVEAIRVLLDERGLSIDAVAAASDSMALGGIDALHARGLRVPEEIAVVGFDDVEEARFATPALTTVRQPLREQGERAVEIVLSQLGGEVAPDRITLHTALVKRRSCGCSSRAARVVDVERRGDFATAFAAQRAPMVADLARTARTSLADLDAAWAERLLDAFTRDLQGGARRLRRDVRRDPARGRLRGGRPRRLARRAHRAAARRPALPRQRRGSARARRGSLAGSAPGDRRGRGRRAGAASPRGPALGAPAQRDERGAGDRRGRRGGGQGGRRALPAALDPERVPLALRARRRARRDVTPAPRLRHGAPRRARIELAQLRLARARACGSAAEGAARRLRPRAALLPRRAARLRPAGDGPARARSTRRSVIRSAPC